MPRKKQKSLKNYQTTHLAIDLGLHSGECLLRWLPLLPQSFGSSGSLGSKGRGFLYLNCTGSWRSRSVSVHRSPGSNQIGFFLNPRWLLINLPRRYYYQQNECFLRKNCAEKSFPQIQAECLFHSCSSGRDQHHDKNHRSPVLRELPVL